MRALLVEDNSDDAQLVTELLAEVSCRKNGGIELVMADRLSGAVEQLRTDGADAILLDLSLPDGRGLEAFNVVHAVAPNAPCIVLTGLADESLAAEAVRRGAHDYLIKGELTSALLVRSLEHAIDRTRLVGQVQALRAEQARGRSDGSPASESEVQPPGQGPQPTDLYAAFVKNFPMPIAAFHLDNELDPMSMRLVAVNPAASMAMGVAVEKWIGQTLREALPDFARSDLPQKVAEVVRSGVPVDMGEIRAPWSPFRDRVFTVRAFPLFGRHVGVTFENVTERVRLAEQYHQAQKMEAVARLAGGVAHDLNNLLMVIKGFSHFVQEALPLGDPARDDIAEVLGASDRAVELVGQLLTFARRRPLDPRIVNLNGMVLGMRPMLQRLLGNDIELAITGAHGQWHVKVDPGQMQQVIMSLAANARDAMPAGGRLTIDTDNVVIAEGDISAPAGVPPGDYVKLSLSDTGIGMTPEVQAHAFEPFFTTKDHGKGKGLGLSTCHGSVKQARGHIFVRSDPQRGTTFEIYLPRTVQGGTRAFNPPGCDRRLMGSETILVLEDEPCVRAAIVRTLRLHGYVVLDADDPEKALTLCERYTSRIDLLVTDILMPGMSGLQFVERVAPARPEMKVLYISGLADESVAHRSGHETAFLAKPFTNQALARRVRDILDLPQGSFARPSLPQ